MQIRHKAVEDLIPKWGVKKFSKQRPAGQGKAVPAHHIQGLEEPMVSYKILTATHPGNRQAGGKKCASPHSAAPGQALPSRLPVPLQMGLSPKDKAFPRATSRSPVQVQSPAGAPKKPHGL